MDCLLPEVAAGDVLHYLLVFSHQDLNHRDRPLAANLLHLLQGLLTTSQRWPLVPTLRFAHEGSLFCSTGRENFLVATVFEAGLG